MIDEEILKEFKIFVQSSSYNRNLFGGSIFLYEKEKGSTSFWGKRKAATNVVDSSNDPKISKTGISGVGNSSAGSTSIKPSSSKIEIVFSFDTTGSMYPCLSTVRSVLRDTLKTLTAKIPGIRIGIIAHGDYCDENTSYVTKASNNYKLCGPDQSQILVDFVSNVGSTYGGDFPECYELVLHEVRTKFDWSPGSNKSLVLIGDAPPHEWHENLRGLDWIGEAKNLKEAGIRVYAVQALDYKQSESFYSQLASLTMGFHLRLYQFSCITEFLLAVCYKEADSANSNGNGSQALTSFETTLTSSGRMVQSLRGLFNQLQGRASSAASESTVTSSGASLIPVSPSRFQVLTVDVDQPIKQFAEARGLLFKAGKGFYEFSKPEAISDKKEIILMDAEKETFFTGWAAARGLAGIEPGSKVKQSPKGCEKYVFFVQSTSYNRKLIAGQRFLYEVDSDR